jgi:raffinose/stachyose/melibiose transport system permease protein
VKRSHPGILADPSSWAPDGFAASFKTTMAATDARRRAFKLISRVSRDGEARSLSTANMTDNESARPISARGWTVVLVFLPPAILLFTVFVALPILEGARYGFYNWDGYGAPDRFVGLKNYGYVFGSPGFLRSLFNNFLVIAVSLLIELPLALAVAVMVAGTMIGAKWFRLIFFMPYVLADVGAGLIWRYMFDGDYGFSATITDALGLPPYFLIADNTWAISAILIVIIWKYFGFYMMLYVAGLQGVDKSLLEAAEIDGASAWQRFRHITLPLLGPMIRLSIFFSVVGSLQLFDFVVPLTGGGPFGTTNTMVSFLYYFGITRMRVGFGSAVGVLLFLVCVTFAIVYRRLFMRDD